MTTSGITSWPLTAEELVSQALYELGAYAAGETPSGSDMDDGIVRLNAMLKTWAGEGNLFREELGTIDIAGGTGSGTLPTDVISVGTVRYVGSATNKRLLGQWNRSQYYSLPNRDQTSSSGPTIYYIGKSTSGLAINVWPVPASDYTLELDYNKGADTVTDPSETVDVPEDWQECVILGLASRCASMFGTTRVDPNTVQRIDARSSALYERLMDRDRPDSYIFETDC